MLSRGKSLGVYNADHSVEYIKKSELLRDVYYDLIEIPVLRKYPNLWKTNVVLIDKNKPKTEIITEFDNVRPISVIAQILVYITNQLLQYGRNTKVLK